MPPRAKTAPLVLARPLLVGALLVLSQTARALAAASEEPVDLSQKLEYPPARRDESCVETKFGYSVPDPYRWLEDPDSEETQAFIEAQNALSRPYYSTQLRANVLQGLKRAYNYPKQGVPTRHGDIWASWYNAGLQNQSVLHVRSSRSFYEKPRVLLDPNTWTKDGTAAVRASAFTEDGSLFAYSRSDKGSDWAKIYFMNSRDGLQLPDVLERVKFSSIVWAPDNSGVFYNAYDFSELGRSLGTGTAKLEFRKVYFHRLGTQQDDDVLIVHHRENPGWLSSVTVSWDQRYLILSIRESSSPNNQIWIADMAEVTKESTEQGKVGTRAYDFSLLRWEKVVRDFTALYTYVSNDGSLFYFLSDKDAPRKNLLTYDIKGAGT